MLALAHSRPVFQKKYRSFAPAGAGQRAPQPAQRSTQKHIVMEFLNKIELKGVIGRAEFNTFNGNQVCNFSVVTEAAAMDREGNSIVEPTWFNVSAWNGVKGIQDLSQIQKGYWVHVIGRLRTRKYVSQDNVDRISLEIPARLVEIIPKEEEGAPMQPQRNY